MTARAQDKMPFVPPGDVLTNPRKSSFNVIASACLGFSAPSPRSLLSLPALLRFLVLCLLTAMIDLFPLAWLIISWLKIDTSFCSGVCYGLVMFPSPCRTCLKFLPMISCSLSYLYLRYIFGMKVLIYCYAFPVLPLRALTTCKKP